ncbi:MAG TPA: sulfatase-like hydrolase/transferase [Ferruginibacter sp.]|nr:sulfatase-like hydrolase/transferase [Ferruginibacter sp.]
MLRSFFPAMLILFVLPVQSQTQRPNIIYIMADDLGYADLSCYGRTDYQTPHLDKLASQGVKFMNAYAAAALCTPTRTAFMTGRYPARTPVGLMEPLRWGHKDSLVGLTPDYTSVATLLKNSGYETFLVGKWHLGYDPKFSPNKNGFDYFFGFNAGGIDYVSHKNPRGRPDLYENEKAITREGYITDIWGEKAIEIIRQKHSKPFFLGVMFNAPHWPWQAPGDKPYPDTLNWHKGGTQEKYAAMMKSLDDAVGRIMQAIDDEKMASNTLVIFTSDNGGEEFSDMGIYSGIKETLWEGGIREPAFIRWPGVIPANSVTQQVAVTMDWTATILAVAGAKPDPAFPLDGINILPVCTGKKKTGSRTLYWRLFQETKHKAVREGDWKYLQTEKGEFLFNLLNDPGERNDLKEKNPALFLHLKDKYREWEKQVLPPVEL